MTPEQHPDATPLIDAARAWYDAGYCVVPSHEDGGKRPFGMWRQYQEKRLEWDYLAELLATGRYTGIGVITGRVSGNVEMAEIEGPIEAAVERVSRLIETARVYDADAAKLIAVIASGCIQQTAGGGLHFYYRVSDGPVGGNTKLAHASDRSVVAETRGEGGFAIVAPTTARKGHEAGTAYLFARGTSPAGTPTISSDQRDEIHYLLTVALHEDEPEREHPSPAPVALDLPHHAPSHVGFVEPDSAFGEFRARTTWADILAPLGWTFVFMGADGRAHWTRPGKSPSEGTSATTLEDGPMYVFSTSTVLPAERGLSKEAVYAALYHHGDMSAASRDLTDRGYGAARQEAAALMPWQREVVDAGDLPVVDAPVLSDEEVRAAWVMEHFPLVDWPAIWNDQSEERWIAKPLVSVGRLVALYSAPKVGKSLLMLEMAVQVCTGGWFLGERCARVRVLYVDFENDPRGDILARLKDMHVEAPEDLSDLCYLSLPTLSALDTERGSQELVAVAQSYDCELVVIDTVSRSIKGDENENDTWLAFYRHTGLKLKQAGIALVRLDHSGKDETKGQRGGSAKSGDVDAVWRMSKLGEDTYRLECEAQRFQIGMTTLDVRRYEDPLRHEVASNVYRDAVEELVEAMVQLRLPKDMTQRQYRKAVKDAGHGRKGTTVDAAWDKYQARILPWRAPELPLEEAETGGNHGVEIEAGTGTDDSL